MQDSESRIDWTNLIFLVAAHLMAAAAVAYVILVGISWSTAALAALWLILCSLSITGGYHRLFAHRSYNCRSALRLLYLLFGAASVQNSALKWASDHRRHHAQTDKESDPYNIRRGFWWAHMGWVFFKDPPNDFANVADLARDRLVRFQHACYAPLAIVFGGLLPALIAMAWGDWLGALLVAGSLRLVLQYHATFAVNSVAHTIGSRPYSRATSARDSSLTALITFGEGYHNFHHKFPSDYRNGFRLHQFDPTKWWVWVAAKAGLASNLRRVPIASVQSALAATTAGGRAPRPPFDSSQAPRDQIPRR
ncbi:MAG: fatty acid desaturase [Planctomycetota bacterium]